MEEEKWFGIRKEMKFYDPAKVPENKKCSSVSQMLNTIHCHFQHASANESKTCVEMES
jgi:hypothetical protein